jgi:hypothetical protein
VYTFFAPHSSSYPFLGHLSPPLVIHLLGQKLFCPPVFQFCGRKYIKYNKKNMEFLLVWDKYSYTEIVIVLFPCIYVLQSKLVHLYQTTSFFPSPLPIVASASLGLLYSLHNSVHIIHIQVLGFLPFTYSSYMCSPLSVCSMSNNITAFVLGP